MLDYSLIPGHMRGAMQRYIEDGIEPGGFLKAVLCNDFLGAFGKADDVNLRHMHDWAKFVYNELPNACHGSVEKYKAWVEVGGFRGLETEDAA